jgi:hypothetical protein
VKEFSALDGLPEGNAGWICTDRNDNVWYANSNGCAVYEGQRFRAIDAEVGTGTKAERLGCEGSVKKRACSISCSNKPGVCSAILGGAIARSSMSI